MTNQQETDYITPLLSEFNTKLKDIEEKQRVLKDRMLLIGQNLVDMREEIYPGMADIKLELEKVKKEVQNTKETLERAITEIGKMARKEDLAKIQAELDIFAPLEAVRIQDVRNIIKKELKK